MSTENNRLSFHSRLIRERGKTGKTQQEFADLARVSVQSWGDYERGNVSPRVENLTFLNDHNISLDFLVWGEKAKYTGLREGLEPLYPDIPGSLTRQEELIALQYETLDLQRDKIARINHDLEGLRKEMGRGKN